MSLFSPSPLFRPGQKKREEKNTIWNGDRPHHRSGD